MHRCYDGHFGLITPADESPTSTEAEQWAELEHHDPRFAALTDGAARRLRVVIDAVGV